MVEVKRQRPAVLKEYPNKMTLVEQNEEYNLINGVVLSDERYGFTFIDEQGSEIEYGTQCPIFGIDIDKENKQVRVWEEGKSIPWRLAMKTGEVVDFAKFLDISKRDLQYLKDHFGLPKESIEEVNSYFNKGKTLNKNHKNG